jgi:uncharacterized protein (DUF305 family)
MNKNTIAVIFTTLIIGGSIGFIIGERDRGDYRPGNYNTPHGMHRMSDGTMMSDTGMGMMNHEAMMVESEREFITEMIPHHQEAVDTAKEVLSRGATTPELKTLLENVILAQEAEIASMKEWHQAWYGTPYTPSGKYQNMMRDLSILNGSNLDKAWLEDMINHHMGAIMMAKSVQPHIEHHEITDLTNDIIRTQSEEINLMQKLLKNI